ncbi:hypothetical protein ZWY2020_027898 [Hordeum vulgare]|nr:hypothetical protein ZWY2020_027898 [Hordeum vulgare]
MDRRSVMLQPWSRQEELRSSLRAMDGCNQSAKSSNTASSCSPLRPGSEDPFISQPRWRPRPHPQLPSLRVFACTNTEF